MKTVIRFIAVLFILCSCSINAQSGKIKKAKGDSLWSPPLSVSGAGLISTDSATSKTGTISYGSIQLCNVVAGLSAGNFTISTANTGQNSDSTAINVYYNYSSDQLDAGSDTLNLPLPRSGSIVKAGIRTGTITIMGKTKVVKTGSMTYPTTIKTPWFGPGKKNKK